MSFQRRFKDGRLENTYGDMPVGRIIYDKAGRFAAQLMRPGRSSTVPSGGVFTADNPSAEEIREAVTGFFAYYGKFDIFSCNGLVLTVASTDYSSDLVWVKDSD